MSLEKRSDGCYRIDAKFGYLGRVRRSLHTTVKADARARHAVIVKLWKTERFDILEAFRDGRIPIEQLVSADRGDRLGATMADIVLTRNLWEVVNETLPKMGNADKTRSRYATSFRSLQVKGGRHLPGASRFADLGRADWGKIKEVWNASGTDWMHLRRAVSHLLSVALGSERHPFREQVMSNFPTARENKRQPDLSFDTVSDIILHTPSGIREFYWAAVITGMRIGELMRVEEKHMNEGTRSIHVPGTKTEEAEGVIRIDARNWPIVRSALPAKFGVRLYQNKWNNAVVAAGYKDVHFHDLRHCHGQWAADQGVARDKIQASLRHSSASMTDRYISRRDAGVVSSALADLIGAGQ